MKPLRMAMWSGPRNISTALLRSWGSRPDTIVCDDPLYAHYLWRTGKPHPGAEEVIRCHETDWPRVVEGLLGGLPEGKTIFYQKHMAHHLLPEMDRGWLSELANCFLIRDPEEMLTSLLHNVPEPELAHTGLPQQVEIFELVRRQTGRTPAVLDARDVLEQPEALLRRLCDALEVEFLPCMLRWEPAPRPTDGVWAEYWYAAVEQSTGFQPYRPKQERVPPALWPLEQQCRQLYQQLYDHRLTA
jgi:hypothetical protein